MRQIFFLNSHSESSLCGVCMFSLYVCKWVFLGFSSFLLHFKSMHLKLTHLFQPPRRCEFVLVSLRSSCDERRPVSSVLYSAVTRFVNRRSVRVPAAFSPRPLLCVVSSPSLQCTIFLPRWSAPSQFSDRRINTLYPATDIHHMACSPAFP